MFCMVKLLTNYITDNADCRVFNYKFVFCPEPKQIIKLK